LTPACAGLLEPRGSGLGLLKSTSSAENFIRRLPWSISILQPFCRNSVLKCALHPEIAKNSLKPFFEGSRSFKVIDVDKFCDPSLHRFDTDHECDGRTDRQMPR